MRRLPTFLHRATLAGLVAVALLVPLAPAVPAGAAGRPVAADDAAVVPGELLVRFAPGANASERAAVRSRHGLEKVRDLPVSGVELVRFDDAEHPGTKGQRMRLERSVRWAEPNLLWQPAATPPDDTRFRDQWALENTGQSGGTAGVDIGALDAWDVAADTSGVVVAVIDTGVQISHPDLSQQLWTNTAEAQGLPLVDDDGNGYVDDVHGWDWVHDDGSVYDGDTNVDGVDDEVHGTHVAGTVAATTGNGQHVAGVSDARIMPLKFLGPKGGTTSDAVLALDYAIEMGAHITNNSWGGGGHSQALADKIAEADAAGVLFVAAAGNGGEDKVGDDIDVSPTYPAAYPHANVVTVAATDRNDQLATFSNHGSVSVDLGAPGVSILSTVPGSATGSASGTSMAAPHVTGALAHIRAAYPALSIAEAKDLLLERTHATAALAGKTVSGGRLDLAAALGVGIAAPDLAIADVEVTEGAASEVTTLSFVASLSSPHPSGVTLRWSTGAAGDTAEPDVDYVSVSDAEVTIPAGDTSVTLDVEVVGDADIEHDETVTVSVTTPDIAVADGVAIGTILGDDRPVLTVAGPAAGVDEAGGTATFTVSLSEPGLDVVEVGYRTQDRTATAGTDYTATSGTLRFDGVTTRTVDVTVLDDTVDEADETFALTLHDAQHADIAVAAAQATVVDDDVSAPSTGGGGTSTGGGGTSTGDSGSTTTGGGGGTPTGGGGGTTTPTDDEATTVSSDPEGTSPTASNPLVVSVSSPAGPATISENGGGRVPGHATVGVGAHVDAPAATPEDPLRLSFSLHVPHGTPAGEVTVARNGTPITATCTAAGVAAPDPCVSRRSVSGDVLAVEVLSSRASQWDLVLPAVLRLAGDDRLATAIGASKATWRAGQARSAVLARADDHPDALAGGALAVALDGPLLLTPGSTLDPSVLAELRRVLPAGSTVRLLGGPAAVAPAVADSLQGAGFRVQRISGADRFSTATAIASQAAPAPGAIFVTTGTDFPDALAASAAAGHVGGVVVLTDGGRLPEATADYLRRHAGVPVHAIGGPAAAALQGWTATSIVGADRYATAVQVAERFFPHADVVGVATGHNFPDALAAGARLGRLGAPLLLSPPSAITDGVRAVAGRVDRVELYGGAGALSATVESNLQAIVG